MSDDVLRCGRGRRSPSTEPDVSQSPNQPEHGQEAEKGSSTRDGGQNSGILRQASSRRQTQRQRSVAAAVNRLTLASGPFLISAADFELFVSEIIDFIPDENKYLIDELMVNAKFFGHIDYKAFDAINILQLVHTPETIPEEPEPEPDLTETPSKVLPQEENVSEIQPTLNSHIASDNIDCDDNIIIEDSATNISNTLPHLYTPECTYLGQDQQQTVVDVYHYQESNIVRLGEDESYQPYSSTSTVTGHINRDDIVTYEEDNNTDDLLGPARNYDNVSAIQHSPNNRDVLSSVNNYDTMYLINAECGIVVDSTRITLDRPEIHETYTESNSEEEEPGTANASYTEEDAIIFNDNTDSTGEVEQAIETIDDEVFTDVPDAQPILLDPSGITSTDDLGQGLETVRISPDGPRRLPPRSVHVPSRTAWEQHTVPRGASVVDEYIHREPNFVTRPQDDDQAEVTEATDSFRTEEQYVEELADLFPNQSAEGFRRHISENIRPDGAIIRQQVFEAVFADEGKLLIKWIRDTKRTGTTMITMNRLELMHSMLTFYKQAAGRKNKLKQAPKLRFDGERGIDAGALTREYFNQGMERFLKHQFEGGPIFEGSTDHLLPCVSVMHRDYGVYKTFGMLLAHSVLHGCDGAVGLAPCIKTLLSTTTRLERRALQSEACGIEISIADLADFELQQLLQNLQDNPKEVKRLDLVKYAEESGFCSGLPRPDHDHLLLHHLLLFYVIIKRSLEIKEIRKGMDELGLYKFLCNNHIPENVQGVFPTHSQRIIKPHHITNCLNTDLVSGLPRIKQYFLDFIAELHDRKHDGVGLADLLQFWTGSTSLSEELHIGLHYDSLLPTAHTCFYKLELPARCTNYKSFVENFVIALRHGAVGFMMA